MRGNYSNLFICFLLIIILIFGSVIGCNKNDDFRFDEREIVEKYRSYDMNFIKKFNFAMTEILKITDERMNKLEICKSIDELFHKFDIEKHSYKIAESIILEKYRNSSIILDDDSTFRNYDVEQLYITVFNECYVLDLIERYGKITTSPANWKANHKYLQENYDELITFDNMDEFQKFAMDNYIEVYSNKDKEK